MQQLAQLTSLKYLDLSNCEPAPETVENSKPQSQGSN
jgi:hypothetical protein